MALFILLQMHRDSKKKAAEENQGQEREAGVQMQEFQEG